MKKVKVEDAVGLVLAHDITRIVPGRSKDVAFRRGMVIEKGDVERLLDLGKSHIFATDGIEDEIHEDEAGRRIATAAMDGNMELLPAKEGRINIASRVNGLVSIDRRRLAEINRIKDVLFTVVPDKYPVRPGDLIAATRIVPLYISETLLQEAEAVGRKGLIRVLPLKPMSVGLVATGTEVATGRIQDASARVEAKLAGYGLNLRGKRVVRDDVAAIKGAILELMAAGSQLIVTTSGLSVDPDDLTKEGIEAAGARVISYGTPVFPGAMFLVARLKGRYILGAPACVYFDTHTMLDILLPRIMAGLGVTAADVRKLALGGLCLHCDVCRYPACFFGKGG